MWGPQFIFTYRAIRALSDSVSVTRSSTSSVKVHYVGFIVAESSFL